MWQRRVRFEQQCFVLDHPHRYFILSAGWRENACVATAGWQLILFFSSFLWLTITVLPLSAFTRNIRISLFLFHSCFFYLHLAQRLIYSTCCMCVHLSPSHSFFFLCLFVFTPLTFSISYPALRCASQSNVLIICLLSFSFSFLPRHFGIFLSLSGLSV